MRVPASVEAESKAGWFQWRCSRCAAVHAPVSVRYTCPTCPGIAALDLAPDYERLTAEASRTDLVDRADHSMWRYRRLLPLSDATTDSFRRLSGIGWTPVIPLGRLANHLGLGDVLLKDDARNLTGSLKDRASALVVAKALELGESVVTTASSGNAAVALAGCCAATDIRCVVFIPQTTPAAKIAQLRAYGAVVLRVQGGYDAAVAMSYQAAEKRGWYCRSTAFNPYTAEGKKTAALEIAEQLGRQPPDVVVVPTGDGNILVGLHRGFQDAYLLGWIDRIPRLIAVQSAQAPALYQAWRSGASDVTAGPAESRAESINVGTPQDGFRALRAVRDTGGCVVTVSDEEALEAVGLLARLSGVFVEPSSATAVAALPALVGSGRLDRDERVVLVNTGHGLKDPLAALSYTRPEVDLQADLAGLAESLEAVMPRHV